MNRKSEETKEKQISKTMLSIENRVRHAYNQGYEQGLKASKQEPCEDAISRQAVLNYIRNNYRRWFINDDAFMQCTNGIKDIALVTPQPKTGHWIETSEEYYKAVNEYGGGVNDDTPYFVDDIACSECLSMFSVIDNETERFDYCPHCGARMEGGNEEK